MSVARTLAQQFGEELQQATLGAVRLSNLNRLSGDILRQSSSDCVVLEGDRERVVLPASAVGEIVVGVGAGSVRIDTTGEEDGWLEGAAARRLGTARGLQSGRGAAPDRTRGAGR